MRAEAASPHLSPRYRHLRTAESSRRLLVELYEAAVAGAAPGPVTAAALSNFPARPGQRIWLYAFGKAAYPMAAAATSTLSKARLEVSGGIVVGEDILGPPAASIVATRGDHPMPGRHSAAAADKIGELTRGRRGDDIAIVLISGGTSSLIAAPLGGITAGDLGHLFELLLHSGLDISAMNAIRKRFTRWGAGRLALALAPARTYCYLMSDVLGDDPADIGSGPCAPDAHVVSQIVSLLQKSAVLVKLSPALRAHLTSVSRGEIPETPKHTHPAFAHVSTRIIGSNRLAIDAVKQLAAARSLDVECVAAPMKGEASSFGSDAARMLLERARDGRTGCVVWGGETTVTLSARMQAGSTQVGSTPAAGPPAGGRCQELALAASAALAEGGDASRRVTILAAGTDGRDGNTEAAGAFADATVWPAVRDAGHDPEAALARHDSHSVLDRVGALLPRRFTGTNVMDVVIGLIE